MAVPIEESLNFTPTGNSPVRVRLWQLRNTYTCVNGYRLRLKDPEQRIERFRSFVEAFEDEPCIHVWPETSLPFDCVDPAIQLVQDCLPPGSIFIAGLEHMLLEDYMKLVDRSHNSNKKAISEIRKDPHFEVLAKVRPVNAALVAVKDNESKTKLFLQTKLHPSHLEEHIGIESVVPGTYLTVFTSEQVSFVVTICYDYIYRYDELGTTYLLSRVVEQLAAKGRVLDFIFVIQANMRPWHRTFKAAVRSYHGNPTIRKYAGETYSVFVNVAEGSRIEGMNQDSTWGQSAILIPKKIKAAATAEYAVDKVAGVNRILFLSPSERVFSLDCDLLRTHTPQPHRKSTPVRVRCYAIGADDTFRLLAPAGLVCTEGNDCLGIDDYHGGSGIPSLKEVFSKSV